MDLLEADDNAYRYDTRFLLLVVVPSLKPYFEEAATAALNSNTTLTYKYLTCLLIAAFAMIFSALFLLTSLKLRLCKTCTCSSPSAGSGASITRHQRNIYAELRFGGSELSLPLAASFITLLLLPSKVFLWVYPLIILMSLCSHSLQALLTGPPYKLPFHVHLHKVHPPRNNDPLLPLSSRRPSTTISNIDDDRESHEVPPATYPPSTDQSNPSPNPDLIITNSSSSSIILHDLFTTANIPIPNIPNPLVISDVSDGSFLITPAHNLIALNIPEAEEISSVDSHHDPVVDACH